MKSKKLCELCLAEKPKKELKAIHKSELGGKLYLCNKCNKEIELKRKRNESN